MARNTDLWQRLRRYFRAHFGDRLYVHEPERVLDRMLEEVEACLADARAEVMYCAGVERRLSAIAHDEAGMADRMLGYARKALLAGRDDLAREAVKRHLQAVRQAGHYQRLWQEQQQGTRRLQELMEALEAKRSDLEQRRQLLFSRRQMARTRRTLLKALYSGRARAEVDMVEERLLTDEFTLDAYQELVTDQAVDVVAAPEYMPLPDRVDSALLQLRQELGLSVANPSLTNNSENDTPV